MSISLTLYSCIRVLFYFKPYLSSSKLSDKEYVGKSSWVMSTTPARTYVHTVLSLKVVVTVQLSHKFYLYRIYDTFRVALTYRSKNI